MTSVVLGIGASHSTLMNTNWDEVASQEGPQCFRAALGEAAGLLADARPDAVVVIGSNHFRGFFLDLMPSLTIGVGECLAAGEAGTPSGPLPVATDLARHLLDSLVGDDIDVAFSLRLTVDHGITHSLQYLTPRLDVPIVPVVMNMFAPPLPSLRRAHAMGAAIGRALAAFPGDKRVAVIASGGLSHRLPWPKWFSALSDDDRFLVEAWLNGRDSWAQYDARRREIIRASDAYINSDFDWELLGMLETGDVSALLEVSATELEQRAGNGAQEIRSWLAMAGAIGAAGAFQGRTLAYAAIPEWLTGMGVLVAEPARQLTQEQQE